VVHTLTAAAVTGAAPPAEFVISYWYGPPPKFTTIEHYRRIKQAGFNVVFPPGPPDTSITREQNLRILDFCRQLGLRAVIYDPRMPKALDSPDAKAKIEAIVADYSRHPALMAYFIVDEPSASAFAALGDVVGYLKQRDPRHPGFINLFPIHADPATQLGTPSYDEYVAQYLKAVDPFVISYDHYSLFNKQDGPHFFTNLAVIRNAAVTSRRPFWNIVQLVRHYDYRELTEPELRFQAMQTLAFGGRGLLWYTYWYPGEPNSTVGPAMIAYDGKPTPQYEMVKSINADVRAIGTQLLAAQSWATFHTGEGVQYPPPPGCPIDAAAPGKLTIGVFKSGDRKTFAVVANRDYRKPVETAVRIEDMPDAVMSFDPATRKWSRPARQQPRGTVLMTLPAGGGVLLRW
jgi:hypothetical protein